MTKSQSRNPLELLTSDPGELVTVNIKSKLAMLILEQIKERGLTQKQAAKIMQVSQPRVSSLQNAHLHKYSVDMLVMMAVRLGFDADIGFDGGNLRFSISP